MFLLKVLAGEGVAKYPLPQSEFERMLDEGAVDDTTEVQSDDTEVQSDDSDLDDIENTDTDDSSNSNLPELSTPRSLQQMLDLAINILFHLGYYTYVIYYIDYNI